MSPRTSSDASGEGLFALIASALIITVAAEAAFIHWASWSLLPLIMLTVVLFAIGVVAAVAHLIEYGELVGAPRRAEPEPEAVEAQAPAVRPVVAH